MKPTFMRSPTALREWFEAHHETAAEIWIGLYKRHTGEATVTWPEAVDEALCVGWIGQNYRGQKSEAKGQKGRVRSTPAKGPTRPSPRKPRAKR